MRSSLKNLLRSVLNTCHLDLTKNLEYDRLTKAIMKRVIKPDSNCVDIGCHKGEILEHIIRLAPRGKHFAFEPIPLYFEQLQLQFGKKVSVSQCALSDHDGESEFCFVKNAPAYSGLKKRRYDNIEPEIEEIKVKLCKLDDVISKEEKIDFIKIDVEGGEFDVLKGAERLLKQWQPVVIFECGLGSGFHYGTKPAEMYSYITQDAGLNISSLKSFMNNGSPLSISEFADYYHTEKEYYFIAHP